MLAAVKGIVKGNTVVIDDEDIRDYDGAEVIVTLLNYPMRKGRTCFTGNLYLFRYSSSEPEVPAHK